MSKEINCPRCGKRCQHIWEKGFQMGLLAAKKESEEK
jgi:hypothetical protein